MKAVASVLVVLIFVVAAKAAETKAVAISHKGTTVMTIEAPQAAKVTMEKNKTVVDTKDMVLDLWLVPKAKTVDAAIAELDTVLKSEVLKFKPQSTEPITVAGGEGKHLKGKGVEADDQDPATVDVVVFPVGKHIVVACVHGEGNTAIRQCAPMLKALKTVKAP